jgi:hypothetical protein
MGDNQHILSKSTFMYGCQCPKRLYLHKFKPELSNHEEENQSTFSKGNDVGLLARDLFQGGVSAQPVDTFSYHQSVQKTQQLIERGTTVIYEACFNFQEMLCAVDILVKENNKWYAYEVKATTNVKDEFILDASLQYHVLINSGLPVEDIFIVHLNNKYVRRGELEIQKLFTKESVLSKIKNQQKFVETKIIELKKLIADKKEPTIEVGNQCHKPYSCNFTNHCWKGIEEERSTREAYRNKEYLKEFVGELQYPLFYFDFETVMPAIPEFNESRPYQQVPFQYSLHIQKGRGEELEHFEFLGDGINDPRAPLIKELLDTLGKSGSIIVWYQTFEISRLKELARDFPEFEAEICAVIERIIDLIVPFRKKQFYHPDFNESSSIKVVLPVLVPELSYDELQIQDGLSAARTYAEIKNQAKEVQIEQRESLLKYCKLDTLAMVRILEVIDKL